MQYVGVYVGGKKVAEDAVNFPYVHTVQWKIFDTASSFDNPNSWLLPSQHAAPSLNFCCST